MELPGRADVDGANPADGARALVHSHTPARGVPVTGRTAWLRGAGPVGVLFGDRPRNTTPQQSHRLQTERELLAIVGSSDVQAAQLRDAVEPVADRVSVGEQARRGRRKVTVEFEVRCERRNKLGLVLL